MRRHLMKRKGLYFLIALALGGVGAVHAQDTAAPADASASSSYDGRWYIAPTLGSYYNDTARNTNSRQLYNGLGVEIGRAHVGTPVTNAHLVCRLLLEKKKTTTTHTPNSI